MSQYFDLWVLEIEIMVFWHIFGSHVWLKNDVNGGEVNVFYTENYNPFKTNYNDIRGTKLYKTFGALVCAQKMFSPKFDSFQKHISLSKYVYLVYDMLMLILNKQQFMIQFLDIGDVSTNIK